jgi:hypothetical protein
MGLDPDVRIGDYFYRLAQGDELYQETGLRPMDRDWRSLFAGRQNVQGSPGVQNVRDEDLRWSSTSFRGGGGQAVIDPSQPDDLFRFDRSLGVDLGNTGEIRLAKETFTFATQSGTTPPTTHEGSSFTDGIGTSTVVGDDRRLTTVGDMVFKDVSLGAGAYQVEAFGYSEDATSRVVELGSSLEVFQGEAFPVGTTMRLKEHSRVRSSERSFPEGSSIQVEVQMHLFCSGPATASASVVVSDVGTGDQAASQDVTLHTPVAEASRSAAAISPDIDSKQVVLNWITQPGHTYRVRVVLNHVDSHVNRQFLVDEIAFTQLASDQLAGWSLTQGATLRASGQVNMHGVTTPQQVGSAIINVTGTQTIRLAFTRVSGEAAVLLDRMVVVPISMGDGAMVWLGINDTIWLIDQSPHALAYRWDPASGTWISHANFAGQEASAHASSESHEYVLFHSTGNIYRWDKLGNVSYFALTPSAAQFSPGIAIAGNRLFALVENPGTSTVLYEHALNNPNDVTGTGWTSRMNGPVIGTTVGGDEFLFNGDSDIALAQRIVGVKAGCIFFYNAGPNCTIYEWDGNAGAPLTTLPTGFRGRSVIHGGGTTYVGGGFPTRDTTGQVTIRPGIFSVEGTLASTDVNVSQLDIKLYLDDDPSSAIAAMQLYGSDLWVQTEVAADASHPRKKMRLWRVSLRGDPAPFLENEVEISPDQAAGKAHGLAITWRDRFMLWTKGGPHQLSERYMTSGDSYLRTSRYTFGLLERKLLKAVDIVARCPVGTWVELYYCLDGGDWHGAGRFESSGRRVVSVPHNSAFFDDLQLEVRLRSTDPTLTPTVYAFGALGTIQEYDRAWNLLLYCADENAAWHKDGSQVPGSVGIDYLFALADGGGVVEYESFFESSRNEDSRLRMVTVESPRARYIKRGEAVVSVRLADGGLIPR